MTNLSQNTALCDNSRSNHSARRSIPRHRQRNRCSTHVSGSLISALKLFRTCANELETLVFSHLFLVGSVTVSVEEGASRPANGKRLSNRHTTKRYGEDLRVQILSTSNGPQMHFTQKSGVPHHLVHCLPGLLGVCPSRRK